MEDLSGSMLTSTLQFWVIMVRWTHKFAEWHHYCKLIKVYEGKWVVSDNNVFGNWRYFMSQSRKFELPKNRWTFQEKGIRINVNLTILGRILLKWNILLLFTCRRRTAIFTIIDCNKHRRYSTEISSCYGTLYVNRRKEK